MGAGIFGRVLLLTTVAAIPLEGLCQFESLNGGLSHIARCFEVSTDSAELIVGGSFKYTVQDSLYANGLVGWNGNSWSIDGFAGGSGDTIPINETTGPLYSMALFQDTLFCAFGGPWQYDPSMQGAAYLANGQWHGCGNPIVWFELMKVNGRLFSGGQATVVYGSYMPGIREWTGGAWHQLPNMPPFNGIGTTECATYWHGQYYFAGSFIAGDALSVIAYDGMGQWSSLGEGVGGNWVRAIAGFGDSLFVGGYFLTGPHVQSQHIQLWDGNSWKPFFSEVQFDSQVFDMKVYQGALYICGNYHFTGESTQYGLLRYDGQHLCAIGGAMEQDNNKIVFFQGSLYLALGFTYPPLLNQCIGRLPLDGLVPDECVTVAEIEEHGANAQAVVFPNPASSEMTISYAGSNARSIEVVDILGRPVLRSAYTRSAPVIVDALANGTYTLRLYDAHGTAVAVGHFVKQ